MRGVLELLDEHRLRDLPELVRRGLDIGADLPQRLRFLEAGIHHREIDLRGEAGAGRDPRKQLPFRARRRLAQPRPCRCRPGGTGRLARGGEEPPRILFREAGQATDLVRQLHLEGGRGDPLQVRFRQGHEARPPLGGAEVALRSQLRQQELRERLCAMNESLKLLFAMLAYIRIRVLSIG